MQKRVLAEKMREQAGKLQKLLPLLSSSENHTARELENALQETEQLIRTLSAYKFLIEHTELSSDLNVHLKIMENINKQEEVKVISEKAEPKPAEVKVEPLVPVNVASVVEKKAEIKESNPLPVHTDEKEGSSKVITRKKIEFGINDKYRMINELFHQSASEFSAALDQLNLSESEEDAENYLESLKSLYSWKNDHPLVKMIYSLTQKRFQ